MAPHLASACAAALVEGVSKADASRTATESRSAWTEKAERIARRRALRLTLTVYLRGFGPKATPPPKRLGTPSVPTRARPVPFWRQALAVVKATSPRVRVEAVPRRRALRSARAASCTSDWWKGSAKSSFGRSALVVLPRTVALAIGPHLDDPVAGAGHRAFDQEQVALGVDVGDFKTLLGDRACCPSAPASASL